MALNLNHARFRSLVEAGLFGSLVILAPPHQPSAQNAARLNGDTLPASRDLAVMDPSAVDKFLPALPTVGSVC
jgi:hypothetical protein